MALKKRNLKVAVATMAMVAALSSTGVNNIVSADSTVNTKIERTSDVKHTIKNSIEYYKKNIKTYDKFDIDCNYHPTSRKCEKIDKGNKKTDEYIYLKIIKEINYFIIKRGIDIILEISGKKNDLSINKEEIINQVREKINSRLKTFKH